MPPFAPKHAVSDTQPSVFYHVAPRAARQSILQNGLRGHEFTHTGPWADANWPFRDQQPQGNYMFNHLEQAQDYLTDLNLRNGDKREPEYWDLDLSRDGEYVAPDGEPYDPNNEHQSELLGHPGYDIWRVFHNPEEHSLRQDPESALANRHWHQGPGEISQAEAIHHLRQERENPNDWTWETDTEPMRWFTPEPIHPKYLNLEEHHEPWNIDEDRYDEDEVPTPFARVPFNRYFGSVSSIDTSNTKGIWNGERLVTWQVDPATRGPHHGEYRRVHPEVEPALAYVGFNDDATFWHEPTYDALAAHTGIPADEMRGDDAKRQIWRDAHSELHRQQEQQIEQASGLRSVNNQWRFGADTWPKVPVEMHRKYNPNYEANLKRLPPWHPGILGRGMLTADTDEPVIWGDVDVLPKDFPEIDLRGMPELHHEDVAQLLGGMFLHKVYIQPDGTIIDPTGNTDYAPFLRADPRLKAGDTAQWHLGASKAASGPYTQADLGEALSKYPNYATVIRTRTGQYYIGYPNETHEQTAHRVGIPVPRFDQRGFIRDGQVRWYVDDPEGYHLGAASGLQPMPEYLPDNRDDPDSAKLVPLPWEPGKPGKAVAIDGRVYAWQAGAYQPFINDVHHFHWRYVEPTMAERHTFDLDRDGAIQPSFWQRTVPNAETLKGVEAIKQALPGTYHEEGQTWRFGAHITDYSDWSTPWDDETLKYTTEDESGYGKYLALNDGRKYAWRTVSASGWPHHSDVLTWLDAHSNNNKGIGFGDVRDMGEIPADNRWVFSATPSTSWHLTDNPQFALDPERHPLNNTTWGGDWPHKGLFVGNPSSWFDGRDYVRPYVAEIEHPPFEKDFGGYSGEQFLPAEQFPHSKVKRLIPFYQWQKEQYGSGHEGLEVDDGDVRDWSPEQVAAYKEKLNDYIKTQKPHMLSEVCPHCASDYVSPGKPCPRCGYETDRTDRFYSKTADEPFKDYRDIVTGEGNVQGEGYYPIVQYPTGTTIVGPAGARHWPLINYHEMREIDADDWEDRDERRHGVVEHRPEGPVLDWYDEPHNPELALQGLRKIWPDVQPGDSGRTWRFGAMPKLRPWEPGKSGKYVVTPEGETIKWLEDRNHRPHHTEVASQWLDAGRVLPDGSLHSLMGKPAYRQYQFESAHEWQVQESDFDPANSYIDNSERPDRWTHSPFIGDRTKRIIYLGQPGVHHADLVDHHWDKGANGSFWRNDDVWGHVNHGMISVGNPSPGGAGEDPRVIADALHKHLGPGFADDIDHSLWDFESKTAGETRKQLLERAAQWPDKSEPVHELADGWSVRKPTHWQDIHRTGELMGNCWSANSGFCTAFENHPDWPKFDWVDGTTPYDNIENFNIDEHQQLLNNLDQPTPYDTGHRWLQDPNGLPRVAWYETPGGNAIHDPLGRHNDPPKEEYHNWLKSYADAKGLDLHKPRGYDKIFDWKFGAARKNTNRSVDLTKIKLPDGEWGEPVPEGTPVGTAVAQLPNGQNIYGEPGDHHDALAWKHPGTAEAWTRRGWTNGKRVFWYDDSVWDFGDLGSARYASPESGRDQPDEVDIHPHSALEGPQKADSLPRESDSIPIEESASTTLSHFLTHLPTSTVADNRPSAEWTPSGHRAERPGERPGEDAQSGRWYGYTMEELRLRRAKDERPVSPGHIELGAGLSGPPLGPQPLGIAQAESRPSFKEFLAFGNGREGVPESENEISAGSAERLANALANMVPYQRGAYGKGLIHNGEVHLWDASDDLPEHQQLHHVQVLKDVLGHYPTAQEWADSHKFWIEPHGQITAAPSEAKAEILARLNDPWFKGDEGWHFGAWPGFHGRKGLVFPDGDVDDWLVDAHGAPHHTNHPRFEESIGQFWTDQGQPTELYASDVYDDNGNEDENAMETNWQKAKQILEAKGYKLDSGDSWKFGAADPRLNWNLRSERNFSKVGIQEQPFQLFSTEWTPGHYGKAIVFEDGRIKVWNTQGGYDGSPTHWEMDEGQAGLTWRALVIDPQGNVRALNNRESINPYSDEEAIDMVAKKIGGTPDHDRRWYFESATLEDARNPWWGENKIEDEDERGRYPIMQYANGHTLIGPEGSQHYDILNLNEDWDDRSARAHGFIQTAENGPGYLEWYDKPFDHAGAVAELSKLFPGLEHDEHNNQWKFGSLLGAETPEGFKPWHQGVRGKGVELDDGTVWFWATDERGSPHHAEVLDRMQEYHVAEYWKIDPQGNVSKFVGRYWVPDQQWHVGAAQDWTVRIAEPTKEVGQHDPQYGWRRPVIVDPNTMTIYVGNKGDYHFDLHGLDGYMNEPDTPGHFEEELHHKAPEGGTEGFISGPNELDPGYEPGPEIVQLNWDRELLPEVTEALKQYFPNVEPDIAGDSGTWNFSLGKVAALQTPMIQEREEYGRPTFVPPIWRKGKWGKAYVSPDGQPYAWVDQSMEQTPDWDKDVHHSDAMHAAGNELMNDWGGAFHIDNEGHVIPALRGDKQRMKILIDSHPDLWATEDELKPPVQGDQRYHFGAEDPETPEPGEFDQPWQPGNRGKGMVLRDGSVRTWHFEQIPGSFFGHHVRHPDYGQRRNFIEIAPDGTYHLTFHDPEGYDHTQADIEAVARHDPRLQSDQAWRFGHITSAVNPEDLYQKTWRGPEGNTDPENYYKPWERGHYGKGVILNDGTVLHWRTPPDPDMERADSFPAHTDMMDDMGILGEVAQGKDHTPFWLTPEGDLHVGNWGAYAMDHDPVEKALGLKSDDRWRFAGLPWDMPSEEVGKKVNEYWSSSCPNCGAEWKDTERAGFLGSMRYCRKCHHEWMMDPNSILQDDPPLPPRSEKPEIFEGGTGEHRQFETNENPRRPAIYIPKLNHIYVGAPGAYHSDVHKDFKHLDNHELEDDRLEGYVGNKYGEFWDTTMQKDEAPPEVLEAMKQRYGVPFRNESERGQRWNFSSTSYPVGTPVLKLRDGTEIYGKPWEYHADLAARSDLDLADLSLAKRGLVDHSGEVFYPEDKNRGEGTWRFGLNFGYNCPECGKHFGGDSCPDCGWTTQWEKIAAIQAQWTGDPEDKDPHNLGEYPVLYDDANGELLVGYEGLHHGDVKRHNSGYFHGVAATQHNPTGGGIEAGLLVWLDATRPVNEKEIIAAVSRLIGWPLRPESDQAHNQWNFASKSVLSSKTKWGSEAKLCARDASVPNLARTGEPRRASVSAQEAAGGVVQGLGDRVAEVDRNTPVTVETYEPHEMADSQTVSDNPWVTGDLTGRRPMFYEPRFNTVHVGPFDYAHSDLVAAISRRHHERYQDSPPGGRYGWVGYNPEAVNDDDINEAGNTYGWFTAPENHDEVREALKQHGLSYDQNADKWHFGGEKLNLAPYQPGGILGKVIIWRDHPPTIWDGAESTITSPGNYPSDVHHSDVIREYPDRKWEALGYIERNGQLAGIPQRYEDQVYQALGMEHPVKAIADQWHFGAEVPNVVNGGHDVPRMDQSIWTTHPWELGRPGKGIYLDGKLHLWAQEGGMEPHHDDIFDLVRGPFTVGGGKGWDQHYADYYAAPKITIDPDGTITRYRTGKPKEDRDFSQLDNVIAMHPDLKQDQNQTWSFT